MFGRTKGTSYFGSLSLSEIHFNKWLVMWFTRTISVTHDTIQISPYARKSSFTLVEGATTAGTSALTDTTSVLGTSSHAVLGSIGAISVEMAYSIYFFMALATMSLKLAMKLPLYSAFRINNGDSGVKSRNGSGECNCCRHLIPSQEKGRRQCRYRHRRHDNGLRLYKKPH